MKYTIRETITKLSGWITGSIDESVEFYTMEEAKKAVIQLRKDGDNRDLAISWIDDKDRRRIYPGKWWI